MSGDFWDNVKVTAVTCSYAERFLRRKTLPKGWRSKVIARNISSVCGGDRIRFYKGKRTITASRSAC